MLYTQGLYALGLAPRDLYTKALLVRRLLQTQTLAGADACSLDHSMYMLTCCEMMATQLVSGTLDLVPR
jgi:hypothetical protein